MYSEAVRIYRYWRLKEYIIHTENKDLQYAWIAFITQRSQFFDPRNPHHSDEWQCSSSDVTEQKTQWYRVGSRPWLMDTRSHCISIDCAWFEKSACERWSGPVGSLYFGSVFRPLLSTICKEQWRIRGYVVRYFLGWSSVFSTSDQNWGFLRCVQRCHSEWV